MIKIWYYLNAKSVGVETRKQCNDLNKMMNKLSVLDRITLVLVIVGALNWGLVGAMNFNLVSALFGDMSGLSRLVYVLVGLSAVYLAMASTKFAKK